MEYITYFDKESPDFNYGLWGKYERLAANRVVICVMTEYGLCNNMRIHIHQINKLIESLQTTTGIFKARKTRVKLKNSYIRQRHISKPIRTLDLLEEYINTDSPIEGISL